MFNSPPHNAIGCSGDRSQPSSPIGTEKIRILTKVVEKGRLVILDSLEAIEERTELAVGHFV